MECLQIVIFLPMVHLFFQWIAKSNLVKREAILRNDNWAFQSKMIFRFFENDLDFAKQAQEVIFNRKTKKLLCLSLSLNNIPFKTNIFQKHLGSILDVTMSVWQ